MIKNYFVRGESIKNEEKGVINFFRYLQDSNHKNHKGKTEKIYTIHENKNFLNKVCMSAAQHNLSKKLKGRRGGRTNKHFAHSFCFSPPEGVKLSKTEMNELSRRIIKVLSEYAGISSKELLENTFINVHEQDNTHLNILTGKILGGKSIDWGKLSLSHTLKLLFNVFLLEFKGLDVKEHQPKNKKKGYKSNIHQHKNEIKEDELNKKEDELNKKEDDLNTKSEELGHKLEEIQEELKKVKIKEQENNEQEKKIKKIIKNIGYYTHRIIVARFEKDKPKEEKNQRLLNKGVNKLKISEKKQIEDILSLYEITLE